MCDALAPRERERDDKISYKWGGVMTKNMPVVTNMTCNL